ncbi:MAG: MBL fold metallo-hydrolase [Deltaproteobacteria bacterium]|nr:MBL fold metallo-hydrolase [Deltaproteobacteria bacterium]
MKIHPVYGGYANTYLIESDEGIVAVDVGSRRAARQVMEQVRHVLKRDMNDLKLITATHYHIDHIGGIPHLRSLFPRAEVNFHSRVGAYLRGEQKLAVPPFTRWFTGLLPVMMNMNGHGGNLIDGAMSAKAGIPLPFLRRRVSLGFQPLCNLEEGKPVPAMTAWELIATPGHTPDSISFLLRSEGVLISGDTILNMSGTGEVNRFCCSSKDIQESFERLCSFDIRSLYPGHGKPIINKTGLLEGVDRD